MVATSTTHRTYTRGGRMERLSVQLQPDLKRRVKRLGKVMDRSASDVMSRLIQAQIAKLEQEHAAALAVLPPGAEDE